MYFIDRRRFLATTATALAISAAGCSDEAKNNAATDTGETERLTAWLDARFDEEVARSPMFQGYLGMGTNMDKWDDISAAREDENFEIAKKNLADLNAMFDPAKLTPAGDLSRRIYAFELQTRIDDYPWRNHQYPVNQMFGWQQEIPSFLINIHRVGSKADAEAYITRLNGVAGFMDQVLGVMERSEAAGVLPPKFVFDHVLAESRNVISGAPYDESGTDSTLLGDIRSKVEALDIPAAEKETLMADATAALLSSVRPAFEKLIALCEAQQSRATEDDGVWKLPNGAAFYEHQLRRHTTTGMSADEIHDFGLAEVERIHGEMQAIMQQVGFQGDLKGFFKFMKEDPQFYYPQTEEGKAAYLARAKEIIDTMRARLDDVFLTKPKADIIVKAVEPFREKTSTTAFYQPPGAFDSRPGTFYANLYDMSAMSKYEMEALAYHEGIPGHHMQIAIAQELEGVPKFRNFNNYTAYAEGWGLYCEQLPKEMGFYADPYSDFGRLTMELWRACRLVVDTGLHAANKKWTRAQAVQYLFDNTPGAESDVVNSIDRYIVMPGQATAYKIGMAKILELRDAAKARLGDAFDIREYHDVVLTNGAVPLSILSENVDAWVARKSQA